MHDFVSHILRQYFHATAWNEYNSYLHLTSSSAAILDFPVPTGLSLSISASPTPPFFTTYRLGALPNLRAGIGYIYASTHNPIDFGKSSKDVKLKEIIERFRIVEAPRRPAPVARIGEPEYYWLGGERFAESPLGGLGESEGGQGGEYLVYGCMHVPSARLDALWTKRISPTWQLIVTAVSTPPKYPLNALHSAALATQSAYTASASTAAGGKGAGLASSVDRLDSSTHTLSSSNANLSSSTATQQSTSTAPASYGLGPPGSTNLQLTLQRDTGRWFTEYSYSVDDALWGFRVLHNFGAPADTPSASAQPGEPLHPTAAMEPGAGASSSASGASKPRIDATHTPLGGTDDTDAGGGLRGRFSAGAEVFVSTVEKSAGLSTGIRFSTLPDTPASNPIITPFDPANALGPSIDSPQTAQNSGPSQPPTVITATLNPMMGHLSTAYAARMARDVVVCSRFDFNVYSYESEWTVGAEYWLRKAGQHSHHPLAPPPPKAADVDAQAEKMEERSRPVAVAQTLSLRESPNPLANATVAATTTTSTTAAETDPSSWSLRPNPPAATAPPTPAPPQPFAAAAAAATAAPAATPPSSTLQTLLSPITGVLKARISTTSDIRLLWQGRLSNCLVSLGVKADLSPSSPSSSSPTPASSPSKMGIVKSIGLEVMYFSAAEDVD